MEGWMMYSQTATEREGGIALRSMMWRWEEKQERHLGAAVIFCWAHFSANIGVQRNCLIACTGVEAASCIKCPTAPPAASALTDCVSDGFSPGVSAKVCLVSEQTQPFSQAGKHCRCRQWAHLNGGQESRDTARCLSSRSDTSIDPSHGTEEGFGVIC